MDRIRRLVIKSLRTSIGAFVGMMDGTVEDATVAIPPTPRLLTKG